MHLNRSQDYNTLNDEEEEVEPRQKLRMVLLGRTGSGKSAAGNTILNDKGAFTSKLLPTAVTMNCEKKKKRIDDTSLCVVDTPGLCDPEKSEEDLVKEVSSCISLVSPGPHVFLVVLRLDRFTVEEKEAVKIIQKIFGDEASNYTLALFTRGDDLEADGISIEEFIKKKPDLRAFIRQCGGGFHVFNNRSDDPSQVRKLLEKIGKMTEDNGGSHYTNEMLQEAERAIREEEARLMAKNPNMEPGEARRLAEMSNPFTQAAVLTVPPTTGAAIGGVVGGPIGAVVGYAAGLLVSRAVVEVQKIYYTLKTEKQIRR